jgi:cytochrome c oxidase subunit 1
MPMFVLGMMGMPRRYYDYLPRFETGNFLAGIGAAVMFAGLALVMLNLLHGLWKGERATAAPWGGTTLEWMVPSPPPLHNFVGEPVIPDYPYDFPAAAAGAAQETQKAR